MIEWTSLEQIPRHLEIKIRFITLFTLNFDINLTLRFSSNLAAHNKLTKEFLKSSLNLNVNQLISIVHCSSHEQKQYNGIDLFWIDDTTTLWIKSCSWNKLFFLALQTMPLKRYLEEIWISEISEGYWFDGMNHKLFRKNVKHNNIRISKTNTRIECAGCDSVLNCFSIHEQWVQSVFSEFGLGFQKDAWYRMEIIKKRS